MSHISQHMSSIVGWLYLNCFDVNILSWVFAVTRSLVCPSCRLTPAGPGTDMAVCAVKLKPVCTLELEGGHLGSGCSGEGAAAPSESRLRALPSFPPSSESHGLISGHRC